MQGCNLRNKVRVESAVILFTHSNFETGCFQVKVSLHRLTPSPSPAFASRAAVTARTRAASSARASFPGGTRSDEAVAVAASCECVGGGVR